VIEVDIVCPVCHSRLNEHVSSSRDGAVPKEDDLALCAECGSILVLGPEAKSFRVLPQAEIDALPAPARALVDEAQRLFYLKMKMERGTT